jgi:hypothetical protein
MARVVQILGRVVQFVAMESGLGGGDIGGRRRGEGYTGTGVTATNKVKVTGIGNGLASILGFIEVMLV